VFAGLIRARALRVIRPSRANVPLAALPLAGEWRVGDWPPRIQTMSQISDKPMGVAPGPMPAESEMGNGPERRRAGRYPFTAAAEIIDLSSHARVAGRSSDLGTLADVTSTFFRRLP